MARYSGSPTVHRAMTGPRMAGGSTGSPDGWKREVLTTLYAIQQVRQHCDSTELLTVRYARKAGLSWTEIAAALGVTRQSAWERWHEIDETLPEGVFGPLLAERRRRQSASNLEVRGRKCTGIRIGGLPGLIRRRHDGQHLQDERV